MIGERSSRRKRLSRAEPFLAEFELAQRPTKLLLTLGTRHYDEQKTLLVLNGVGLYLFTLITSPPKKELLLIISLPPRFQEKKSITIVLVGTSHLILSCYVIAMYVSILLCYTLYIPQYSYY